MDRIIPSPAHTPNTRFNHLSSPTHPSLAKVLCNTAISEPSLETTSGGVNDEHSGISLGSASDHVLDEITMARGINDGENRLGGWFQSCWVLTLTNQR